MHGARWGCLVIVWVGLLSLAGLANTYPVYYDCLLGRDTVVVISSLSSSDSDEAYHLRIYDCIGELVYETAGALGAYESTRLHLGSVFEGSDEGCLYGLAVVESSLVIRVAAWYREDGVWIAVDSGDVYFGKEIYSPVPEFMWYCLQFADTSKRSSAYLLLNPGGETASITTYLIDSSGRVLDKHDFRARPNETLYYVPEDLDYGEDQADGEGWGTLVVQTTHPLILVGEHYELGSWLIDLDVVREAYYFEYEATD